MDEEFFRTDIEPGLSLVKFFKLVYIKYMFEINPEIKSFDFHKINNLLLFLSKNGVSDLENYFRDNDIYDNIIKKYSHLFLNKN